MNILRELRLELENFENQLEEVYGMCEEEVCARYNVDYKEEAIDCLNDNIELCTKAIELAEYEETRGFVGVYVDPAFDSLAEFDALRI